MQVSRQSGTAVPFRSGSGGEGQVRRKLHRGNGQGRDAGADEVRVSKPFFAWLTTFEGRVRIVRPAEVKQAFAGFVERIAHNMK